MENGKVLFNISRNMAGQYTCTGRNPCGNNSKKVDIDVQYHMKSSSAVGTSDMSTDVGTDERFWSFLSVLLCTPNSKEKCKNKLMLLNH